MASERYTSLGKKCYGQLCGYASPVHMPQSHEFDCGTMICRSGSRKYDVPVPGDADDRPA
jgi:hypothetical protein